MNLKPTGKLRWVNRKEDLSLESHEHIGHGPQHPYKHPTYKVLQQEWEEHQWFHSGDGGWGPTGETSWVDVPTEEESEQPDDT